MICGDFIGPFGRQLSDSKQKYYSNSGLCSHPLGGSSRSEMQLSILSRARAYIEHGGSAHFLQRTLRSSVIDICTYSRVYIYTRRRRCERALVVGSCRITSDGGEMLVEP